MRTTTRTHRKANVAGSTNQAPSKADSASGQNQNSAPRFEGVIESFDNDDSIECGWIKVSPELAASLGNGDKHTLLFPKNQLPPHTGFKIRPGAKVSFCLGHNARVARAIKVHTMAAELPEDGWVSLVDSKYFAQTVEIYRIVKSDEALHRDQQGNLFVVRRRKERRKSYRREIRQVSFAQACDWFTNKTRECEYIKPEFFFARHGIAEQARLARQSADMSALKMRETIGQAFTLIELMEHALTSESGSPLPKERQDTFASGLICLKSSVQRNLLALEDGYNAARKGGAR